MSSHTEMQIGGIASQQSQGAEQSDIQVFQWEIVSLEAFLDHRKGA